VYACSKETATAGTHIYHTNMFVLQCCKALFSRKGIQFRDIDVSRDTAAARDMMKRSGQMGVPVIDIGGKIVVGFDRAKIDRYLGL